MLKRLYQLVFLALLWGPPLIRSRFSNRTATSSMRGDIDGAALLEVSVWLLGGALVYLSLISGVVKRKLSFPPGLLRGASGAYFAYVALELMSILYAPAKAYAGFRALQISIALLCAAILVQFDEYEGRDKNSALQLLFFFCSLNVIYNIAAAILIPDQVFIGKMNERLIGGYLFRPDYGIAALGVLVWQLPRVVHRKRGWWLSLGVIAVAGTLLVMARTRTNIGAAMVAILVILASQRGRTARATLIVTMVGMVIAGYVMWGVIAASEEAEYIARTESLQNLSGRLDVWPMILQAWWDAPFLHKIFGFGYVTGSRVMLVNMHFKHFGNTHNAMLETLVSTGFLGVVVALSMIVHSIVQVARLTLEQIPKHLEEPAAQSAALLAGTLVMGIGGLSFANMQYIDLMMFIVGIVVGRRVLLQVEEARLQAHDAESAEDDDDYEAVPALPIRVLRAGR